jgi:hypothetical protein
MITKLSVATKNGEVRVLHGIKADKSDQSQYLAEFVPCKNVDVYHSDNVVGKTVLNSSGLNEPKAISFNFNLKRGLYDVYISKIERIDGSDVKVVDGSRFLYKEPVMVGDPYRVKLKKEDTICYGYAGTRVRILSEELMLDSETVYYQIKREELRNRKFYIPFNGGPTADFFVKGVSPDEVDIFFGNSSFQIENNV